MPLTDIRVFCELDGESPFLEWLEELKDRNKRAYDACLTAVLRLAAMGYELRRPEADLLEEGVYELRKRVGNVHYRILYGYVGQNAALLSHGFTKEAQIPAREIALARRRLELARDRPDVHARDFEV